MAPYCVATSCAATLDTLCTSPGSVRPRSVATKPTQASWQMRPCLSSASRSHLMSITLVKPRGSKPTSPARVPSRASGFSAKGSAFDFSLRISLEEWCCWCETGSMKAVKGATRKARRTNISALHRCTQNKRLTKSGSYKGERKFKAYSRRARASSPPFKKTERLERPSGLQIRHARLKPFACLRSCPLPLCFATLTLY